MYFLSYDAENRTMIVAAVSRIFWSFLFCRELVRQGYDEYERGFAKEYDW